VEVKNEMSNKEEKPSKETVDSPTQEERAITTRPSTFMSRGVDSLFDDFRRSFDNFMAPFLPMRSFFPEIATGLPVRAPLVDVTDHGDSYVVKAELPGYKKEMVDIEMNKDTLILSAKKKLDQEERGENFVHRERSYTTSRRTINFPEEVNPEEVNAILEDGILKITVSKKEPRPDEQLRKISLK
jgi:HSP20 family protein